MRRLFGRYLDTRIETYKNARDVAATEGKLAEGAALQEEIWAAAVSGFRRPDATAYAPMLMVPALNQMIDITTTRAVATQNHPPSVIFALLGALSLVSASLVGYVTCLTTTRTWFYHLLFAVTMSLTFYVIVDLEFPRLGLIRIDSADQTLIELRETMR